ncbi:LPS export ABC transporter periplasmic protein LptC [Pelomonas sp. SE-A7]|uniref:LPS export ABC transporter periplasmic protein LptC n=1 Tax=Pelomonas sp. SE-A7 TaxID=3054953 RepID=UPI00259C87B0|nr:LPS export ABC transporter periplasmic protein LptC [Pelomonas sp. SE-A7]MDM4767130.1 LPS export ABC transporter periplasmic protein LptC [Pelomonas sp. SE-A7]
MSPAARLAPAAGPRRPVSNKPWVWRVQGLLSTYLPVLLMVFLAAGTSWLVKNSPQPDDGGTEAPLRHEPDYQMQGFGLQRFDPTGGLRVEVEGREMRHYPDTDTVEVDGVRLRSIGQDGSLVIATAQRAVGNGDGSEMQLMGDVLVQRYPTDGRGGAQPRVGLEIRGEFLHAFLHTEQLRSHLPVRVSYGHTELQMQGFEFDNLKGRLLFKGRSTARFESSAARRSKPSSSAP